MPDTITALDRSQLALGDPAKLARAARIFRAALDRQPADDNDENSDG